MVGCGNVTSMRMKPLLLAYTVFFLLCAVGEWDWWVLQWRACPTRRSKVWLTVKVLATPLHHGWLLLTLEVQVWWSIVMAVISRKQ